MQYISNEHALTVKFEKLDQSLTNIFEPYSPSILIFHFNFSECKNAFVALN